MTEADWLTACDPGPMLRHATPLLRDDPRTLRLFACAWAYSLWRRMPDDGCREAVMVAERYADGAADDSDLYQAFRATDEAWKVVRINRHRWERRGKMTALGRSAAMRAVGAARNAADPGLTVATLVQAASRQNGATQYRLATYLRDLLGNPFRPPAPDPRWLTSPVVGLAAAVYGGDAFDRLPILADALEEAGCENPEILAHCRGDHPHVRGCWVIDLVLGRATGR